MHAFSKVGIQMQRFGRVLQQDLKKRAPIKDRMKYSAACGFTNRRKYYIVYS